MRFVPSEGARATLRFAATTAALLWAVAVRGQDAPNSDSAVLGVLFDEQHTLESALDVHRRAESMDPAARFVFLARWVLPNESHAAFRLSAGFTPTHPAPIAGQEIPERVSRWQTGGEIVSPALDLVRAAASLGKLDELRRRVETTAPASLKGQIDADFTFTADNARVLFAMRDPALSGFRVHALNCENTAAPAEAPIQPSDINVFDCDVSPDGRRLAFSGQRIPSRSNGSPRVADSRLSLERKERCFRGANDDHFPNALHDEPGYLRFSRCP